MAKAYQLPNKLKIGTRFMDRNEITVQDEQKRRSREKNKILVCRVSSRMPWRQRVELENPQQPESRSTFNIHIPAIIYYSGSQYQILSL
jgi:hypothetical protein